jgi:Tc toxin complex TcA C-terminal TcB-binding domain
MVLHAENFLAIRTIHPRTPWRFGTRVVIEKPASSAELDYRDLLSEANECFFHREFTVALERYLELRQKITIQSHPELPITNGLLHGLVLDAAIIDPDRIIEFSRRLIAATPSGAAVVLPADDRRLFSVTEVVPNPALAKFAQLAVDPGFTLTEGIDKKREAARRLLAAGRTDEAQRIYQGEAKRAASQGDLHIAADLLAENAAVLATYAEDGPENSRHIATLFQQAADIYATLGNETAVDAMRENLVLLRSDRQQPPEIHFDGPRQLPKPLDDRVFKVPDGDNLNTTASLVARSVPLDDAARTVGVLTSGETRVLSLDVNAWKDSVVGGLLDNRRTATTLEQLRIDDVVGPTFVAYLTHLYFYTLTLAIGDSYAALGQHQQAINYYTSVLSYPWLNADIEGSDLWRRIASTQIKWADELFRRGLPASAKPHYEQIVTLPFAVPAASPLYQPAAFSTCRTQALEVVKQLLGQPSAAVNPKLAELVTCAARQLLKIDAGLNVLGLADDYAPVLRFSYLQSAANYLADNAIQAERTFIQFRTQAEQQKFERIQLENAVALNEAAVAVEQKRLDDAALEVQAAQRTRALTQLRTANAQANLNDWNTIGAELASVNAALAWASNAANDQDITYTNVRYHGESHDYSGDVEDFFDTVGEVREWLNFDIQQNRLQRQVSEAAAEVAIATVREQQSMVRLQVQQLNAQLAATRLEGSQEVLEYAENRMFDEDLWFRLAGDMQDLARGYLDMAIEAAYVMERAYELEFDRDLHRIRLDYGVGGPDALLGGDHLKQDIASFALDYIQHAQKQNPIRVAISMREEFPQAFDTFQRTGAMEFRTDLEIFDRRYPGTWKRKIKRVEAFVEGLIPPTGISGVLQHAGVSTEWRNGPGGWFKHNRIVPEESMILSSYQFRRDYAVLTPREEVLTLFENLGPQGNWKLIVWPSANDVDFESISDVTLVVYLDGDTDAALETHTRALYGTSGGRSFIRSARLHEPDEYFQLDRDRSLSFHVRTADLPAWVTAAELTALTVRLLSAPGAAPLGSRTLTITRASDAAVVTAATDANGVLASDPTTMAPFDAWLHDPLTDTYTIAFANGDDLTAIIDVQLAMSYRFVYRADPGV